MATDSSSSSEAGEGPRQLGLRRRAQERYVAGQTDGFRLVAETHDAVGLSPKVFRYLRVLNVPAVGQSSDVFDGVCSPVDLEELPEDNPGPSSEYPFFRSDSVDLVFDSQAIAEQAWQALLADVTALVKTLALMDELGEPEDHIITG